MNLADEFDAFRHGKVHVGKQVRLCKNHGRGFTEEQGILERFVLALGDAEYGDFGGFPDVELGRADEIPDVLDYDQIERVQGQVNQRVVNQLCLKVAGPAGKKLAGWDSKGGDTLSVTGRFDVALQNGKPEMP